MIKPKASYVFSEPKFCKMPLSCLGGFIQGLTVTNSTDFNVIRSVSVYGDMVTVEWCSAFLIEE